MSHFADRLSRFLTEFPLPPALPALPGQAEAYRPFGEPTVRGLLHAFASKYYLDAAPPRVALREICGIANDLPPGRPELSTQFVYRVVAALGGPAEFYHHFFLSSIYPLVLLNQGLNYNYYDSPALTKALWPDLQRSLRQQVADFGLRRDVAVSLGRRNGGFLTKLNKELGLFDKIVVLDHPRYLMQYRRRDLDTNVAKYVETLGSLVSFNN